MSELSIPVLCQMLTTKFPNVNCNDGEVALAVISVFFFIAAIVIGEYRLFKIEWVVK